MSAAAWELVSFIERKGGRFAIEGEELVIRPGDAAMPVIDELRQHKTEIIALLQSRTANPGDLFPVFPPRKPPVGTEIPAIYKAVPSVPSVPTQKVDVCADEDLIDDLRPPFVQWFDSRIHLDARGIALRQTPTWSTTVHALHADCVRWTLERDLAPPTSERFLLLLRELCCSIRVIGAEQFVDYVALKQDVQALEQFERSE